MNRWLLLSGAIAAEVIGTLSLRAAVDQSAWFTLVAAGYLAAFGLLGLTLQAGMPIGAAYGIWGAAGVALVAVFSAVIFSETLSASAMFGIAVIIIGVFLVQTGVRHNASGKAVRP